MSNNSLCNLIGGIGCLVSSACFLCYFFGMGGLLGTFIGLGMMGLALVNYD